MLTVILIALHLVSGVFGISTNVTIDGLGTIIGLQEYTEFTNRRIYTFRGIPFAEPPIGDLRFRPPVKLTSWNQTTLYASEFGHICPQTVSNDSYPSSEDCLTLNVYVPEVADDSTTLPVMIWIHGGMFMSGSAQIYEPHFLLEKDVILVVPQFRLGPLGLLCLQTDEVPGNVQFLDQILAMQWVQDNIQYFGGNPDEVTLFGQSSGAASVNLHQFSPLSKGLFHRAIMQSGSALAPWIMDYNPVQTAQNFGAVIGCNQNDTTQLAACFKALNPQIIVNGFNIYLALYNLEGLAAFGGHRAVIQTAGTQRFLEEDPSDLLIRAEYNQMPIISGATKHDGSFLLAQYYQSYFLPLGLSNSTEYLAYNFTSFIVNTLGITDQSGAISQTLMHTHYEEDHIGDFLKMVPGVIDICSVFVFKAGIFRMMQTNSVVNISYLYSFGYFGSDAAIISDTEAVPFEMGVGHSDELVYLFPISENLSDQDIVVAKRMVSLWTSFAITGQPTADDVTWEPISTPFGPYIIIEEEVFTATNYLSEYTIALKEGMTAVDRSAAFNGVPQSVAIFATIFWTILKQ